MQYTLKKEEGYLFLLNCMAKSPIGMRALLVKVISANIWPLVRRKVPLISRPLPFWAVNQTWREKDCNRLFDNIPKPKHFEPLVLITKEYHNLRIYSNYHMYNVHKYIHCKCGSFHKALSKGLHTDWLHTTTRVTQRTQFSTPFLEEQRRWVHCSHPYFLCHQIHRNHPGSPVHLHQTLVEPYSQVGLQNHRIVWDQTGRGGGERERETCDIHKTVSVSLELT